MLRALKSTISRQKTSFLSRNYSIISPNEPYKYHELANKVKLVTNPLPNHFSAIGVYVNAGSRFETPELQGCSHMIDKLAFNSTENISGVDMLRQLESLGGNYMCSSSRESIMYQASVFNDDVEHMARLLGETVIRPRLSVEEIEEQKNFAAYEIEEIWKKPELILPELLHVVAYNGENLGSPLLCTLDRLPMITKPAIDEYRQRFYNPQNVTVAFIGVEEEHALQITDKYFGQWHSANSEPSSFAPAQYTGGEFCLDSPAAPDGSGPELSYIYLAFEGMSVVDKDIYALALLQTLLGGGGSFSAGGPGKGMYAKLYTEVLNKYGFIENCTAFNHSYYDSGLFGISSACVPNAAPYLVEIVCQQLAATFQSVGKRGISDVELNRSRNQLKSSLLMNLESKMVELEDLGRQIQVHGYKIPLAEMIEKIDQVTLDDIRRVAEKVMTGSKASIVIQGKREEFGDIDRVLEHHGLGGAKGKEKKGGFWG